MFDEKIAKYAVSMSWRFLVAGIPVMFLVGLLVPVDMLRADSEANSAALIIIPLLQIFGTYCTMYLTLLWMSRSSKDSNLDK